MKNIVDKKLYNVLVIDDENITTRIIKEYLKDNFNVYIANNYNETINLIKEVKFNLLLIDINMPEKNGFEIIEELKEKVLKINIPFIFLTSSSDSTMVQKAFSFGASDYVKKPIDKLDLTTRVQNSINSFNLLSRLHVQTQELNQYKEVLNESDIISKTNKNGIITYVNNKFCEVSGYSKDELIGRNQNIVKHPDNPPAQYKELWKTITSKKVFKGIIKNRKKNGDTYYVDATISPILDIQGNIIEYIGIRHDVTHMMEPKDQLIDLLNVTKNPIVTLAQISNYDIVKEFYDEKIRKTFESEIAKYLEQLVPQTLFINKIFNLGNGLYGFIGNKTKDTPLISSLLNKVQQEVEKTPIEFDDYSYDIDIVFSFSSSGNNLFDDALLGISEALTLKESIVNANNYYNKKQEDAEKKISTLKLIKNALKEENKVISFYQPIVDNSTQDIVKYESLIRIKNDKNEILSPFFFLDIAKKTGYYHQLTLRIIENSRYILQNTDISININLSLSDLSNLNVRNELLNLITEEKNQGRVTFELLEDEEINDFATIKDFISISKILGQVKIAIDDFGSGYSNFQRLLDFQPDYVKIDGSLIKEINEPYTRSAIKSIVLFAKENNIKTVAEFVSDENIYLQAKELGIDFSQGYYFGKPEEKILKF